MAVVAIAAVMSARPKVHAIPARCPRTTRPRRSVAMPMVKKSISVTDRQSDWMRAQIETGHYGNESEIIRALIRERQMQQQETPEEIAAIRVKLLEAERSGFSDQTVDQIWNAARNAPRTR